MKTQYKFLRVREYTNRQLKIVAALRHEPMIETLEKLVMEEAKRLNEKKIDD